MAAISVRRISNGIREEQFLQRPLRKIQLRSGILYFQLIVTPHEQHLDRPRIERPSGIRSLKTLMKEEKDKAIER
jgi:hypothetical protein